MREEEANINLGEEREDSAPITGEIRNLSEEIVPVEANETPKIKENRPKPSGASPKSPIPQVSSIQEVSSILPYHASSILVQLISQSHPESVITGRILRSPGRSQAGPLGFMLIGTTRSTMVGHVRGLITQYP